MRTIKAQNYMNQLNLNCFQFQFTFQNGHCIKNAKM